MSKLLLILDSVQQVTLCRTLIQTVHGQNMATKLSAPIKLYGDNYFCMAKVCNIAC